MHDLNDIEAWPRRREKLLREAENRRTIRTPEVVRLGKSRRSGSVLLERAHARLPWRRGWRSVEGGRNHELVEREITASITIEEGIRRNG